MVRFLEVPDFHFSPANLEICKSNGAAVKTAAIDQKVDFIALPGDLNESALYASNKGGYNDLRKIVDSWAETAPVIAIEGTPSHDAPGAYEGLNVTLLQPGKIYGYHVELGKFGLPEKHITEWTDEHTLHMGPPDAILFGIPEVNKKTIQATLKLSAEQANAEAEQMLKDYVYNFIAPLRLKYKEIPTIVLYHGNMSDRDRSNESDEILRASDIIARAEWFLDAQVDRVSCGHIHQPAENGLWGYAGSWGGSWNDIGFIPAFNCVEIDGSRAAGGCSTGTDRIPYGTPKRLKIRDAAQATEAGVAYWLESKDPNAVLPGFVHEWSRITFDEPDKETRRVTAEQAEQARSLWDLALLLDPKTPKKLKPLFDEISEKIPEPIPEPADIYLEELHISGCTFFKGKDIKFNISDLTKGLTAISGGNGAGKSSLLAFCSPYPVIIGKDTESGRASAIKEFFNQKDSNYYKKIRFNNQIHEHVITIKGAHTQSAKVECYLNIDGAPQLERGTFDEMMGACEAIYGPFEDYRITTFYEQPQQSQKTTSGLMSATKTTARDLVLGISGIDRDKEKRFALDQKLTLEKSLDSLRAEIKILSEKAPDIGRLQDELETLLSDYDNTNKSVVISDSKLSAINSEIDKLITKVEAENEKSRELQQVKKNISNYQSKIQDAEKTIDDASENLKYVDDFKSQLAADDSARKRQQDNTETYNKYQADLNAVKARNHEAQSKYDNAVFEERKKYEADLAAYKQQESKRQADGRRISEIDNTINQISDPCEKCGHIKSTIAGAISDLESERSLLMEHEYNLTEPAYVCTIQPPQLEPNPPEPFIAPVKVLDPESRRSLEARIEAAGTLQNMIDNAQMISKEFRDLLAAAVRKEAEIIIDKIPERDLAARRTDKETISDDLQTLKIKSAQLSEAIKHQQADLNNARQAAEDLSTAERQLKQSDQLASDWDAVARMLNSDKIPALELEIILDNIDGEATRNITPFRSAIYSFKTETQEMGKKALVDRFDIKIHDATTGEYRSFFKHSPGEKAFFNDAYIKALLKLRNRKMLRNYSPIISDEADGPVEPGKVADYYEIQNNYFKESKVLIVSHAPDAQNYIQNSINIEEIKR